MRRGYVGLDNSHADHLITTLNVVRPSELSGEDRFPHLWGRDPARALW